MIQVQLYYYINHTLITSSETLLPYFKNNNLVLNHLRMAQHAFSDKQDWTAEYQIVLLVIQMKMSFLSHFIILFDFVLFCFFLSSLLPVLTTHACHFKTSCNAGDGAKVPDPRCLIHKQVERMRWTGHQSAIIVYVIRRFIKEKEKLQK